MFNISVIKQSTSDLTIDTNKYLGNFLTLVQCFVECSIPFCILPYLVFILIKHSFTSLPSIRNSRSDLKSNKKKFCKRVSNEINNC